jgi:succinate dehydrogenase hydrophobic anchor subunit
MHSRNIILAAALVVIVFGAVATVSDVVRNGPTPLALVSLFVLAMFAFGIVGALRHPEGP